MRSKPELRAAAFAPGRVDPQPLYSPARSRPRSQPVTINLRSSAGANSLSNEWCKSFAQLVCREILLLRHAKSRIFSHDYVPGATESIPAGDIDLLCDRCHRPKWDSNIFESRRSAKAKRTG